MSKSVVELDQKSRKHQFRFSGHETFACRFAWIPKACLMIGDSPKDFLDDEAVMVQLGLGKNMVRSLRFWIDAMGVASQTARGFVLTPLGREVFGPTGFDRYLEHPATAWILHWKLCSRNDGNLFAWHILFNKWPFPEFSRADLLESIKKESKRLGFAHSDVTLGQHLDALLHTYIPSQQATAIEDRIDGPLAQLELIRQLGNKQERHGKREPLFVFSRGHVRHITPELMVYFILDFWQTWRSNESTISVSDLVQSNCSPGRALRLTEFDMLEILDRCVRIPNAPFALSSSAIQHVLTRSKFTKYSALKATYGSD